jgi:uncharacterized protein YecE (DUF72 family)
VAKADKTVRGAPLPLFAQWEEKPLASPYVRANAPRLRRWAERGIFFGSSSWKYPGWKGTVYNRHYSSQRAFEQTCIAEYATVFPTVCADFALYDFPGARLLQTIYEVTPEQFTVSFKVTDRITVKRYPGLPRYGANAGKDNPDFLNVTLFEDAFLRPLETLKHKRGAVIFEFSTFHPGSGITPTVFIDVLGAFLAGLPRGFTFCVEIRNREFLTAGYLAMLASHGVAHVLNNWTRMPPVIEQIRLTNVLTAPFSVVRALLKPGRTYQEAVERFQPYENIKEENPELRLGLAETVTRCVTEGKKAYVYVNNRAEGNSPKTIEAILDILDSYPVEKL